MKKKEDFIKFISKEESRRGFVLAFKGEANTTIESFIKGFFLAIFTRRFISESTYNQHTIEIIKNNYTKRLIKGQVSIYHSEIVIEGINELKNIFDEKDKGFWSGSGSAHIRRARVIQRATCYLNALGFVDSLDLKAKLNFDEKNIKYKNPGNTFKGFFKGLFKGFFGGLLSLILGVLILMIIFSIIGFIIELFM
tara:strand:+ start:540 stop:1124 length:585 start_codon:yes stop_codon:yes gene_type:complete